MPYGGVAYFQALCGNVYVVYIISQFSTPLGENEWYGPPNGGL